MILLISHPCIIFIIHSEKSHFHFPEKNVQVQEHASSTVVFRCDYTRYVHPGGDVTVEWFHVDKKIKASPDQKITQKVCYVVNGINKKLNNVSLLFWESNA